MDDDFSDTSSDFDSSSDDVSDSSFDDSSADFDDSGADFDDTSSDFDDSESDFDDSGDEFDEDEALDVEDDEFDDDSIEDADEGLEEEPEDADEGIEEEPEDADEGIEEEPEDADEGLDEEPEDVDEGLEEEPEEADEGIDEEPEDADEGIDEEPEEADEGIEEEPEDADEGIEEEPEDADEGLEEEPEDADEGLDEEPEDADEGIEEEPEDADEGIEEEPEDADEGLDEEPEDADEGLEEEPEEADEGIEEEPEDADEGIEEEPEDADEGIEEEPEDADEGLDEEPEDADEELEDEPEENSKIDTNQEAKEVNDEDDGGRSAFLGGLRGQVNTDEIKPGDLEPDVPNDNNNENTSDDDDGQRIRLPGNHRYGEREIAERDFVNKNPEYNQSETEDINKSDNINDVKDNYNDFDDIKQYENDFEDINNRAKDAIDGAKGSKFEDKDIDAAKNRYGKEMQSRARALNMDMWENEDKMNNLQHNINNIDSIDNGLTDEQKVNIKNSWQKQYDEYADKQAKLQDLKTKYETAGNDLVKDVKEPTTFVGANGKDFTDMDKNFIQEQGHGVEGYKGTCGCCSSANAMNEFGNNISEKEIVEYAKNHKPPLCEGTPINENLTPAEKEEVAGDNGGTYPWQREKILDHYGYDCETPEYQQSLDDIYKQINQGKTAMVALDCHGLDKSDMGYTGRTNHCVTVKGVEVGSDGKVRGMWVHDTGNWSSMGRSCYISKEQYDEMSRVSGNLVQYVSKR